MRRHHRKSIKSIFKIWNRPRSIHNSQLIWAIHWSTIWSRYCNWCDSSIRVNPSSTIMRSNWFDVESHANKIDQYYHVKFINIFKEAMNVERKSMFNTDQTILGLINLRNMCKTTSQIGRQRLMQLKAISFA